MQITHGKYKQEKRRAQVEHQLSPEEREGNQRRATARAKTQIRRDLLTSQADRMLTLTYKENMTDRSRAVADLARFHRSMLKKFPYYQAVAVLEWQQRGAAHFHLGISGFYDADIVRDVWRSIVGEGNVDIAFKPDGRGNAWSKLATYMGKYLAKNLDQGRKFGQHRYFRCHISDHPKEVYHVPDTCPPRTERLIVYDLLDEYFPTNRTFFATPVAFGGWFYEIERVT